MKLKFSILIAVSALNFVFAKVSLPYFFSDNMVLQRDGRIPLWGFANPGEKVTVNFKNQTKKTVADGKGNWKINLDPEKFGGPYEMNISGENRIVFKNVWIGDVWLCGGQSNMEWNLGRTDGFEVEKNQTEFPEIHHIKIHKAINTFPNSNVEETQWQAANAQTIEDFSGVAYHFAKIMFEQTRVPIGLINASWGGTNIETWIPKDAFVKSPDFRNMISKMPENTVEELLEKNSADRIAFVEQQLHSKITDFSTAKFLDQNYDDTLLPEIYQPKIWEEQGFEGVDGIVWLRKTILLTPQDIASDAKIFLTKIDDKDVTYFNGIKIGETQQYDLERAYTIPKKLLKEGKNVIEIQVTDTGGGGGIYGAAKDLKLQTAKNTIPLEGSWKISVEKIIKNLSENDFPSMAYNGMVAPLAPFALKGILWYQGESNAARASEYKKSFPLLINSWREKFGEDLPFYYVQLATFGTKGDSNAGCDWCELREAQTSGLKLKNTGMVVTTDVGNIAEIHPRNKKTVGERLANLALKNGIVSPVFKDFKIEDGKISIGFSPVVPLKTSDGAAIRGFEIAGSDQKFMPAQAKIIGNRVSVFSKAVKNPKAVRYGWKGDDSWINLVSGQGLPVSPFRTDDYRTVTKDASYKINLR